MTDMIEPRKNEVQKSKQLFKYFKNFLMKLPLMEKGKN